MACIRSGSPGNSHDNFFPVHLAPGLAVQRPRCLLAGFGNTLAILAVIAQLPEPTKVSSVVYAMTVAGLAILYRFPYLTRPCRLRLAAPMLTNSRTR